MSGSGTATGCYKCGRPGHWSRDCPFTAPNPNPNTSTSTAGPPPPTSTFKPSGPRSAVEKPKKPPRTRPKLTPELLLSDDGLGYILRYFPRNFKYHGRGQEVRDLGKLLELYSEWHSRLLPYYSFNQFVHKVEKVAATRRVKAEVVWEELCCDLTSSLIKLLDVSNDTFWRTGWVHIRMQHQWHSFSTVKLS